MVYSRSEKAILKTIIYSDIFNCPVSEEELWRFLIIDRKISRDIFEKSLVKLSSKIIYKEGMYSLLGKEESISKRKMNVSEVMKKTRLAKHAAYVLSHIPTVYFVGLSGGVAAGNAEEGDDVDLFIITKKGTLFVTRFLIILILEALNLRRRRNDTNPTNKICVNFLIDESALSWPVKSHDIYTAHEIVQMKPLFERLGMYRKLLSKNQWIKRFFPNARPYRMAFAEPVNYYTIKILSSIITFLPIEFLMMIFQKKFMKRYRTKEFISNHILAFHPRDYRRQTLRNVSKRYKQFGILEPNSLY